MQLSVTQSPNASPNSLNHGLQVHLSVIRSRPPNPSPNTLHHSLQGHLQTRSITASKCISEFNLILASKYISKLAPSWPPSAFLTYKISASKCIFKLARSRPMCASLSSIRCWPPSASLSYSISASKPARSRPPSASQSSTRFWHLQTHSMVASKSISQFTLLRPPSSYLNPLNQRLQVLLRLRSSTVCSQIGHMYIQRDIDR